MYYYNVTYYNYNYLPMSHNLLYHGSSKELKILQPMPSKVVNGEKVVFATDTKDISVIFIPKWSDCDLDLGYYKNNLYVIEQYPNAFDLLRNVKGFVYTVNKDSFVSDQRLGMKSHEFISREPVEIKTIEDIDDVYAHLLNSSIIMITFEEKMDAMLKAGLFEKNKNESD